MWILEVKEKHSKKYYTSFIHTVETLHKVLILAPECARCREQVLCLSATVANG